MAKRWTLERVQKLFEDRNCTLLETEYRNSSSKLRYIASCGHEHHISLENFRAGKGDLCRQCRYEASGEKHRLGSEKIREYFEREGCVVLDVGEGTNRSPVRYIAQCGHENIIDFNHFSQQGGGRICSKCSKSIRYELDYVREAFEQQDCVLLEDEYINCKTPMRYIAQCGHESYITFDIFQNCATAAKRCRSCHKHSYHEVVDERNMTEMKRWRRAVYDRDGYSCVACGKHGGDLNAHHLVSYGESKELRLTTENGVTLCPSCHIRFHREYGFGNNTPEQFNEWLKGIPR